MKHDVSELLSEVARQLTKSDVRISMETHNDHIIGAGTIYHAELEVKVAVGETVDFVNVYSYSFFEELYSIIMVRWSRESSDGEFLDSSEHESRGEVMLPKECWPAVLRATAAKIVELLTSDGSDL